MRYDVDPEFATVGAREDIDGAEALVVLCPDRRHDEDNALELAMDAKTARALARRLNRWARLVDTPANGRRR